MDGLVKWNENYLKPTGLVLPEDLSYDDWIEIAPKLRYLNNAMLWAWGDYIRFGERRYGEMYSQALEESDYANGTLRNASYVCGQFELSRRRDNLPISFHQEVAGLEIKEQDLLLDTCESENWTQSELRKAVRQYKRDQAGKDAGELPEGKYSIIYCDPPWEYSNSGFQMSAEQQYPTMPTDDLCEIGVAEISAENSVCFMWTTNPLFKDGIRVLESWGFEYKTNIVWIKDRHTAGFYVFGQHEILLIGVRGSLLPTGEKPKSIIKGANLIHSKKPKETYRIIEKMYPGALDKTFYCELFCRETEPGWKGWGNEV